MTASLAETFAAELAARGVPFDAAVTPAEAERLRWDWSFWRRPEQAMPPQPWRHWLVLAGRGMGKTRLAAEAIRESVATNNVEHLAFVGKTAADVRDVMVEGPSGILAVSPNDERPRWEPSKRRLTWRNGARSTMFSGEEPDAFRGPQHQLVWTDEFCAFQFPQETWENLEFGLRIPWRDGSQARAIHTTTPRPIRTLREIMSDAVVTGGNTFDNAGNLDAFFLAKLRKRYEGTRLGRQELYAEILEDVLGALWTRDTIDKHRVARAPGLERFTRIVVAIDPAATSTKDSAETGIVVAGLDEAMGTDEPHVFVLADRSGRLTPGAWGARAVQAAYEFGADSIVCEVNNGGEMVAHTIRTVDPNIKIKMVHASRGKKVRGEPVSALYDQGRVHHCGLFPQLEDQQVSWTGAATDDSPDRFDALVWAVTELALPKEPSAPTVHFV